MPAIATRTIAKPTNPTTSTKNTTNPTATGLPPRTPSTKKTSMPPSIGTTTARAKTTTTTATTMVCTDVLAHGAPEARACVRYAATSCEVGVVSSGA